jgi:signal transduction histidine kinase/ligand-binding sensor domain-containing protein
MNRTETPLTSLAARAGAMLLLLCLDVCAYPAFSLKLWTADDGLPQNIIRGVRQTQDGYLWLATLNGLVRFDGVHFTIFDKTGSPGLLSGRFTSLYTDSRGEMWAATDGGGVVRYRHGRITTYTTRHGLPVLSVRAVTGDGKGRIWVLCADVILAWDEKSGRFVDITPPGAGVRYDSLLWGQDGFWGVDGGNVRCFSGGIVVSYRLPPWIDAASVRDAARDRDGALWVEDSKGAQARITTAGSQARTAAVAFQDRQGRGWTFGVGPRLVRYLEHPQPGRIEKIPFSVLAEDREGNLWLGTEGQGLYQLRPRLITTYSAEDGLADRNVYPIIEDRQGAIWIGGWQGGLSRWFQGKFHTYRTQDGLAPWGITALAEDREGRLWIGANEQLRVFAGGRFRVPAAPVLPQRVNVQTILADHAGTLWFGTSQGLLRFRDGRTETLSKRDGLATDDVRVLVESASGGLWIGGYGGLSRLRDGRVERWTEREGLPSNAVRAIYEDPQGVVWIGSYEGGLGRFENGKFTRYTTNSGLFNNAAFQILEDARGNLWMSCNRGIYRVSKKQLNEVAGGTRSTVNPVGYGRADGMRNAECNGGYGPAGVRARDGRLWFPTQDGVAVVDPSSIPDDPPPPPVLIESVLLDGESVPTGEPLRIAPGKQSLEIRYTAPSFVNPEQVRFRYRLEGLDSGWNDVGPRRTAYYSHVPPGEYVFSAIAGNSDGFRSEGGPRLPVIVLAPFYRTWWFQFAGSLAALGIVALAWRYRVAQFRRNEAVQHAFSRQLIASQENERKRIAAELHDSLGQRLVVVRNLAMFFLREHRAKPGQEGWLNGIEEISSEAGLAIKETREISYNLRPFQLDRLGLTKAVEALVRTASGASATEFTIDLDNVDDLFAEDLRINFYRIVQECLNNIVKHAQASKAHISIRREGARATLTIYDNGRGFETDGIRPESGTTGFGQTGMAERATLLGGRLEIRSTPGRGTTVTIQFSGASAGR